MILGVGGNTSDMRGRRVGAMIIGMCGQCLAPIAGWCRAACNADIRVMLIMRMCACMTICMVNKCHA